ncbi:uncharacterized protein [Dysidea avara]|uniref:uncharacterized protein isoform X2 n=1 Tax=Dysidea avara TaxID=196820 RepID=UPI00333170CD
MGTPLQNTAAYTTKVFCQGTKEIFEAIPSRRSKDTIHCWTTRELCLQVPLFHRRKSTLKYHNWKRLHHPSCGSQLKTTHLCRHSTTFTSLSTKSNHLH